MKKDFYILGRGFVYTWEHKGVLGEDSSGNWYVPKKKELSKKNLTSETWEPLDIKDWTHWKCLIRTYIHGKVTMLERA